MKNRLSPLKRPFRLRYPRLYLPRLQGGTDICSHTTDTPGLFSKHGDDASWGNAQLKLDP